MAKHEARQYKNGLKEDHDKIRISTPSHIGQALISSCVEAAARKKRKKDTYFIINTTFQIFFVYAGKEGLGKKGKELVPPISSCSPFLLLRGAILT